MIKSLFGKKPPKEAFREELEQNLHELGKMAVSQRLRVCEETHKLARLEEQYGILEAVLNSMKD